MTHPDPLIVPVPVGVACDEFVKAIGGFIGIKCNPHRNPNPESDFNRNLYVASLVSHGKEHVAVVNLSNLIDEEATALATFMRTYRKNACVLCAGNLPAHPNNASPIIEGKCCDVCNQQHVLPFRMFSLLSARFQKNGSSS